MKDVKYYCVDIGNGVYILVFLEIGVGLFGKGRLYVFTLNFVPGDGEFSSEQVVPTNEVLFLNQCIKWGIVGIWVGWWLCMEIFIHTFS